MSRARPWSLHWGPEPISVETSHWSAWRSSIANGVEVRTVSVYVAAEAMAST